MIETETRHNFPTVSEPAAMRDFPHARNNERDTLIDYVTLRANATVLDIQAAGGYLSDEIHRRLGGKVSLVCVEPNPLLRARLNSAYRIVDNPVEHFHSIADGSIDVALGLIGLHHSSSHEATIRESQRVLKPGGELAICDVAQGSRLADWLNHFVAVHCPAGHEGNFPAAGSMAHLCSEAGFVEAIEEVREVPWVFRRRHDIALFFKGLFGLSNDIDAIDRALDDFFVIRETPGQCRVDWQLRYCHARKPA